MSAIARLSRLALVHAHHFSGEGAAAVARRLYAFNRLPPSPGFRGAFPDEESLRHALLAGAGDGVAFPVSWQPVRYPSGSPSWLAWRNDAYANRMRPAFKLYVSPSPASVPRAFEVLVASAPNARALKVGRRLHDWHRPDKLVAYFERFSEMMDVAEAVAERLEDAPAQGVPFTAAVDPAGLVSWAVEPATPAPGQLSWRRWLSNRLAQALVRAAAAEGSRNTAVHAALADVAGDGVDTESWLPSESEWWRHER